MFKEQEIKQDALYVSVTGSLTLISRQNNIKPSWWMGFYRSTNDDLIGRSAIKLHFSGKLRTTPCDDLKIILLLPSSKFLTI